MLMPLIIIGGIVLGIVTVAAALRFWDLGARAIHHDESLHATYSWYFMRLAPIYVHDPLMHGPFQFHAMALVFKIFGDNDIRISATCVRVPVVTTHSLAVHAVLDRAVTADEIRSLLENAEGVLVVDDPDNKVFPTPIDVVDTDPTVVGRIRVSSEYPNEIDFFVCGDNLRKGAALNSIQIAEVLVKSYL